MVLGPNPALIGNDLPNVIMRSIAVQITQKESHDIVNVMIVQRNRHVAIATSHEQVIVGDRRKRTEAKAEYAQRTTRKRQ